MTKPDTSTVTHERPKLDEHTLQGLAMVLEMAKALGTTAEPVRDGFCTNYPPGSQVMVGLSKAQLAVLAVLVDHARIRPLLLEPFAARLETLAKRLDAFQPDTGRVVDVALSRNEIKALCEGLTLLRIWRSRELRVGVAIRKPGKVRKVMVR